MPADVEPNAVPLLVDGCYRADAGLRRSREVEWPRICADIDAGRLAMVGLVLHTVVIPFNLTQSHQVLEFAYKVAGDAVTLRIYDPNWPGRDDVELALLVEGVSQASGEDLNGLLRLQ